LKIEILINLKCNHNIKNDVPPQKWLIDNTIKKNLRQKIKMNYEDLNHNKAKKDIAKIVGSVIYSIQRIEVKVLSTGEGSILKNYWDEICVQQQSQRFDNWSLYEIMIDLAIESTLEKYSTEARVLISKVAEYELSNTYNTEVSEFPEMMVEYIGKKVQDEALNYTNKRIQQYLDNSYLD
jgi:hypothetical protein